MAHLKFKAPQIFDGKRMLDNSQVLIVTEAGMIDGFIRLEDAGDDIQHLDGILCPGFINCHCHLELSHMKGLIPEGTGLVSFVQQVMTNRNLEEEKILQSISNAEDEMLDNGIVAVGDICNNNLSIPQKQKGRIWYHNFIEASGFAPSVAKTRFDRARSLFAEFAQLYSIPVESNSIVPHAPYSVSDELWKLILNFPGNRLMTIHNQEAAPENELFMEKSGEFLTLYEKLNIDTGFFKPSAMTSLQTYLTRFFTQQPLILVHNVVTSAADLFFCKQSKPEQQISWCLCPNANKYIGGILPNIEMLRQEGATLVLGTDSLASNHQLSILSEIQTIRRQFPLIPVAELLGWATLNGARALQMESILGSFEIGKTPGVLLCNADLNSVTRLI